MVDLPYEDHKRETIVANFLLELIEQGKIRNIDELKSAYRTATVRTHPDTVGSNERLEIFLRLNDDYLEAKAYLEDHATSAPTRQSSAPQNPRLAFFRQLNVIETLEMPYAYHADENRSELSVAKALAREAVGIWKPDWLGLYARADAELTAIKRSKPSGPYLKNALGLNIRPLMHNLIGYHLTGRDLYLKQARQNLSGIMHRLEQTGHPNLREFLSLLIQDMNRGAAVLE